MSKPGSAPERSWPVSFLMGNVSLRRLALFVFKFLVVGFLAAILVLLGSYLYVQDDLPSSADIQDIRMQVPLRVLTSDERLIAEYGEVKRQPLSFEKTPELLIKAFLAAEDDRYYQHPGVDYQGLFRAAWHLLLTGKKSQGGSTITMQVARNFFLSREKTYLRKLNEIFLSLKMEHEFTKNQILELYLNKIYLGNRAYGVAAAANVYYGRRVDELSLAQMAMIAGLPKAPSRYNPIANRVRATQRRDYVLGRMLQLGAITKADYQAAIDHKDQARLHAQAIDLKAEYAAEMARQFMVDRYGKDAYTGNYQVVTTLDSRLQMAARKALRDDLHLYDERHGYRGPVRHIELNTLQRPGDWAELFNDWADVGDLDRGIVTHVSGLTVRVRLEDGRVAMLEWHGLSWARPYIDDYHRGPKPNSATDILSVGDLIYVRRVKGLWRLAQPPAVEGSLVSLRPRDGAVLALVGGYDFHRSKFNRATQAYRQPGSNFKPFLYSAALDKGFTAASLINDAPVVFDDPGLESAWRPENYSGKFFGPTRLREALIHSRNLVSIRLLRAIGPKFVIDYADRFGFERERLPDNLSLSLGSGVVTPIQLAGAYSVLANGGFKVEPHLVDRIIGPDGQTLYNANPAIVCPDDCNADTAGQGDPLSIPPRRAPRVMTAENNYLMNSLLRDVVRRGTGRRARVLGRHDLAGKTGTTNDQVDAWFSGFNQDIVAVSWVGFDQVHSLGRRETGSRAALPMWISFMREALKGVPERRLVRPRGLVTVRIDPKTGLLAYSHQKNAIFETFRTKNIPKEFAAPVRRTQSQTGSQGAPSQVEEVIPEQLF